ncbi:type II secretion system protein G [Parelusimicrobium proximum]|uniref:type IV pilin protein n=1 Tax=Parelusimicrobium proximum TaxID=3228953 RepID=UPI003D168031
MKKGFTLIELLVVVLIIAILAAVALPQYTAAVEKSRAAEALVQGQALINALDRYILQNDDLPTSFDELDVNIPGVTNCSSALASLTSGTQACVYNSKWNYRILASGAVQIARGEGREIIFDFRPPSGSISCFAQLNKPKTDLYTKICQNMSGKTTAGWTDGYHNGYSFQ